jgi:hypothetical protein
MTNSALIKQSGTSRYIPPNSNWYTLRTFFQGMKYTVYGDPAQRLPGPAR